MTSTQQTHDSISRFPTIKTRSLAGQKMVYPDALMGQKSLLVLVFEEGGHYQTPQSQADQWLAIWEQKWQSLIAHEIPMMTGSFRLARNWIDGGMRADLPIEKHSTVSCFYGDKNYYKKQLKLASYAEAHVYLLDEDGCILFEAHGGPDESTIAQLESYL